MKVSEKKTKNIQHVQNLYDYYIGIDWSLESVSIARMKSNAIKPKVDNNLAPKIKDIKEYLRGIKGSKILTIEETTGAHWLYVELKDSVDKIIICNPLRNRLLEEGPKTDKIDAAKLCHLLRAGLIKEVYHTDDEENYKIRKLISAYDDFIQAEVRFKNQLSALYRSIGLKVKKDKYDKKDTTINFIIDNKQSIIEKLEEEKDKFESEFKKIIKTNQIIKNIKRISGFGDILAVKAYGIIIDPNRFKNKYRLWCYSGLVKNKKESGKKSSNKKSKHYSRALKCVFKMATQAALIGNNDIRDYYEYLLNMNYSEKDARNAITRYIATSVYAVMKHKTKYEPYYWRKKLEQKDKAA